MAPTTPTVKRRGSRAPSASQAAKASGGRIAAAATIGARSPMGAEMRGSSVKRVWARASAAVVETTVSPTQPDPAGKRRAARSALPARSSPGPRARAPLGGHDPLAYVAAGLRAGFHLLHAGHGTEWGAQEPQQRRRHDRDGGAGTGPQPRSRRRAGPQLGQEE